MQSKLSSLKMLSSAARAMLPVAAQTDAGFHAYVAVCGMSGPQKLPSSGRW